MRTFWSAGLVAAALLLAQPAAAEEGVRYNGKLYPCWQVRAAAYFLTKKQLADYQRKATPEQIAAGRKCLKDER